MIQLITENIWSGRLDDEDGELGIRWHQKVQPMYFDQLSPQTERHLALLGFCSDEGVRRNKGRIGARKAPNLLRKALANLPYGIQKNTLISDFGNIILENDDLEKARAAQVDCVSELLKNNYLPIILGGGHETALGDFLAMAKQYNNIGIINIDAHYDLRIPVEQSTSGTPFFEMAHYCQNNQMNFNYLAIGIQPTGNTDALFQRAKELNVKTVLADEVHLDLNFALRQLEDFMHHHEAIYLSLDLDVLDAAFAPGVSAPCANGLNVFQVKSLLKTALSSQRVKLFDVVEYNPEFDIDMRTAKAAAHLIAEFL